MVEVRTLEEAGLEPETALRHCDIEVRIGIVCNLSSVEITVNANASAWA